MFSNSSPLNWHNTLKRLKKDDDFGRSPHSLNAVIVKRRPATLYIAQAMRNIIKDVDKHHKEVPGIKKLIKEAGAKSGSEVIADGTAGTQLSRDDAHIPSRPGDLSVSDLKTPGKTPDEPKPQYNDPVKALAESIKSSRRSALSDSFHTAKSDTPTKSATRQLFSDSTHLPASQVAAVNKRTRVVKAKGAVMDTAMKPLAKRGDPLAKSTKPDTLPQ
jgi:hypothetical protein